MRVDELVAGVKADVAVLLYGDDMEMLGQKGKEIERVLKNVPGAVDVKADYQANIPTLTISAKPDQLARYGVDATELMEYRRVDWRTAVGQIYEGRARFPMYGSASRSIANRRLPARACSGASNSTASRLRSASWPTSAWRNHRRELNTSRDVANLYFGQCARS